MRTSRLLTLTAAGGIGKTRLALEVANSLVERYPDGVWLVELGPIDEAYLVPHVVAAVLGVPEEAGRPLAETLERTLADRRQLLLLDNCEHVLDAAASLIDRLLRGSAGLQILATSREPLGVAGETVWRVPSLSLPPAQSPADLADVDRAESVRLFLTRAQAVRSDFAITRENAATVWQICQRLDGIPLAIELAAASISFLTPDQLVRRLDESARFMTSVDRNAPPRHQTMTAAIAWSHELLSEPERRFFARLSVFAGGFSLEAAESVCWGDGDVLDLLRRLVTKSLVIAEPAADGVMRYRLLEPLRDFGSDALRSAHEANAVQRRHATFYADLARLSNLVISEKAGARWFGVMAGEHDNLHAAMRWLHKNDDVPGALIAGTAVAEVWRRRGHLGEARALLALLLSLPGAAESAVAQAGVLMLAGQLACFQGDLDAAQILLGRAVARSRELDLGAGVVRGLFRLADVQRAQGHYAAARSVLDEALAACPTTPDRLGFAASVRTRQALIDLDEGNYASASALAEQALPILQADGWTRVLAQALMVLGVAAAQHGLYSEARRLLEESLANWNEGDRWGAARAYVELGRVALGAGDDDLAASYFAESIAVCRDIGDPWGSAVALEASAALAARAGRAEQAVQLAEVAAALREKAQIVQSPRERDWLNEQLSLARRNLGTRRHTEAREAGRAMSPAQAFELALRRGDSAKSAGLTPREREIVALLARGLSNHQIAEALVIADSTAQRHVANIMAKLQVTSRAQVGIWAVDHKLRGELPARVSSISGRIGSVRLVAKIEADGPLGPR